MWDTIIYYYFWIAGLFIFGWWIYGFYDQIISPYIDDDDDDD